MLGIESLDFGVQLQPPTSVRRIFRRIAQVLKFLNRPFQNRFGRDCHNS